MRISDWSSDVCSSDLVVESSEQGMLSQVDRAVKSKEDIVFLGWAPHPMNNNFDLVYLSGGDDFFGADYGGATVYTNVRKGYTQECPNVGKLLANLKFSLRSEEHTSELQSLMRISYAVFCLKKKKIHNTM